jgi:polyhydroxyalkanoate synthesis regulator phasin
MPAPRATKAGAPRKRASTAVGVADGLASLVEQLVNRIVKPFDLVLLTRERIQEVLDEAAERGRVTRRDANELALELVRRGREQTDDLMRQLGRAAGRARRSVTGDSALPISSYDELTASQVTKRLGGLTPAELRSVRDYEARHANRKSVLEAVERALR